MVIENVEKLFQSYLEKSNNEWDFGNSILYRMCEDNPLHNDKHVVVGKLWLIGRSYAAAIERRKEVKTSNDNFYYNEVQEKMLSIGMELDKRISCVHENIETIAGGVKDILNTHKFLMDAFEEITGMKKRSLASKYLHFHCPDKFFIYDSRANQAINKLVKQNKAIENKCEEYDNEYRVFVCKMIELQDCLQSKLNIPVTPRLLDSFLLSEEIQCMRS